MDTEVNTGIKCYPAGIAREMEKLVRELANMDMEGSINGEYIQDKAEALVVKLNG